jgi:hypothetical protein
MVHGVSGGGSAGGGVGSSKIVLDDPPIRAPA